MHVVSHVVENARNRTRDTHLAPDRQGPLLSLSYFRCLTEDPQYKCQVSKGQGMVVLVVDFCEPLGRLAKVFQRFAGTVELEFATPGISRGECAIGENYLLRVGSLQHGQGAAQAFFVIHALNTLPGPAQFDSHEAGLVKPPLKPCLGKRSRFLAQVDVATVNVGVGDHELKARNIQRNILELRCPLQ